jgi:hypothetical protein
MMLRALALILLLANLLFFGWSQGWLDKLLSRQHPDREPERLQLETHPERLRLLSPQAAMALQTRACLELGPLNGEDSLRAARAALGQLGVAEGDWKLQSSEQAGLWAVATIKLGSADFRARKEETYKRMKLAYEPLQGLPDEQPSLVLSQHPSEKAAEAALDAFEQRALKGLRVLQLRPAQARHMLSLPRADAALQAQLQSLLASGREPSLAGAALKACAPEAAASAPASAASR